MGYFYIAGTVIFTVYGQLILKWRINQLGLMPEIFSQKLLFLFKALFDPYIFSGLVSAFIASFFWMAAMTKYDVSYAYPFITASLTLITVVMAVFLLGEAITPLKTAGLILIILGVALLGFAK